jgi:hypothetical protein
VASKRKNQHNLKLRPQDLVPLEYLADLVDLPHLECPADCWTDWATNTRRALSSLRANYAGIFTERLIFGTTARIVITATITTIITKILSIHKNLFVSKAT